MGGMAQRSLSRTQSTPRLTLIAWRGVRLCKHKNGQWSYIHLIWPLLDMPSDLNSFFESQDPDSKGRSLLPPGRQREPGRRAKRAARPGSAAWTAQPRREGGFAHTSFGRWTREVVLNPRVLPLGDECFGLGLSPPGESVPPRLLQRDPPAPQVSCAHSAGGVEPGLGALGLGLGEGGAGVSPREWSGRSLFIKEQAGVLWAAGNWQSEVVLGMEPRDSTRWLCDLKQLFFVLHIHLV